MQLILQKILINLSFSSNSVIISKYKIEKKSFYKLFLFLNTKYLFWLIIIQF